MQDKRREQGELLFMQERPIWECNGQDERDGYISKMAEMFHKHWQDLDWRHNNTYREE